MTLEECCDFYRKVCGIPAFISTDGINTIRAGGDGFCVVTTPPRLGAAVRSRMDDVPGRCGPVSSSALSGRWMFLARVGPVDTCADLELAAVNVGITDAATFPLPAPGPPSATQRTWVVPPTDTYLPTRDWIVDAIRWSRPRARR
ncbi:hypothetical protein [Nocardia asteroides]|uniref:hypothetical protein n=1 Tax=Nocardia asteroides TaxID=1824 RepID=UPI001E5F617E|nr:hypothetical protein [Nocardia asteroides]UGT64244.1 hypothetical protein LTT61_13530 [Nocardia asteroides]